MENDMKISIIIPVYGVERYVEECIESVRNQTYRNIEIILVDDGSRDNSPEICDKYVKKDKRILVIHKENGGLSDARNRGIECATGDYVLFLDGDDYWDDRNALDYLVERVRQTRPDVLNFSYEKYYEDTKEKIPYFKEIASMPIQCRNKKEQLAYLTGNHLYIASACNKFIRRDLLNENMRFKRGVYSEDIEWCARLLYYAESIDFICENFYCYRQRRDSIRHTIDDKKCKDLCQNIIHCINLAQQAEKDFQEYYYRYAAYQYGTFFKVQAQAKNRQTECIEILKEYSWILKYHTHNKKLKCLYLGCKILGYKNLCSIIRQAYRNKHRGE